MGPGVGVNRRARVRTCSVRQNVQAYGVGATASRNAATSACASAVSRRETGGKRKQVTYVQRVTQRCRPRSGRTESIRTNEPKQRRSLRTGEIKEPSSGERSDPRRQAVRPRSKKICWRGWRGCMKGWYVWCVRVGGGVGGGGNKVAMCLPFAYAGAV